MDFYTLYVLLICLLLCVKISCMYICREITSCCSYEHIQSIESSNDTITLTTQMDEKLKPLVNRLSVFVYFGVFIVVSLHVLRAYYLSHLSDFNSSVTTITTSVTCVGVALLQCLRNSINHHDYRSLIRSADSIFYLFLTESCFIAASTVMFHISKNSSLKIESYSYLETMRENLQSDNRVSDFDHTFSSEM